MRKLWMLTLGLAALAAAEGCKRNAPEPIPGPKAAAPAVVGHTSAAGIAWFQGSLDEAFARPSAHVTCAEVRAPMAPLGADLPRPMRNRPTEYRFDAWLPDQHSPVSPLTASICK